MRFIALHARGLIPFPGTVDVDFDAIPGILTAVTGKNGAGKTTLLELLAGSIRRQCPTRGSLGDLATTRDSCVEVGLVNGAPWRLKHRLDAVSGKGESEAFDATGAMVLPSTKVSDFTAWSTKHLPDPSVLFASTFAPQGSGGFLKMKPGDRKAVLLRVLGHEKLEALAQDARERARAAKAALDVLEARLRAEKRMAGVVESDDDVAHKGAVGPAVFIERFVPGTIRTLATMVAAAEHEFGTARDNLAMAEVAAESSAEKLTALRAQAERVVAHNADASRARAEAARIEAERDAAGTAVRTLEEKLAALRLGLLDQAEAIRCAATRARTVDAEIAALREKHATLTAELAAAVARRGDAEMAVGAATRTMQEVERKIAHEATRARERATYEAELAKLPEVEASAATLEAELAGAEDVLRRTQETSAALADRAIVGAEGRIEGLRAGLEEIKAIGDGPAVDCSLIAVGALARDDKAILDAKRVPDERAAAAMAVGQARVDLQFAKSRHAKAIDAVRALHQTRERLAAMGPGEDHGPALAEAKAALEAKDEAVRTIAGDAVRLAEALATVTSDGQAKAKERTEVGTVAARMAELDGAEALRSAYEADLAAARARYTEAVAHAQDREEPPNDLPSVDVATAETADRELAMRVVEKRARVGDAERAVRLATEARARIEAIVAERSSAEEELADWTRLGADLGRDGIQAAEIDAVGGELTAIANDLLHTCVSTRWTVQIDTQKLASDGKRLLEGCEVRVLDTEDGHDKEGAQLSGGEGVLVGEAISLAIAVLACRYWGIEGPTLVRDETGAALDVGMAPRYVAMLRRAAGAIGASRVLFVSHDPAVQALADARLHVEDGRVTVEAA